MQIPEKTYFGIRTRNRPAAGATSCKLLVFREGSAVRLGGASSLRWGDLEKSAGGTCRIQQTLCNSPF